MPDTKENKSISLRDSPFPRGFGHRYRKDDFFVRITYQRKTDCDAMFQRGMTNISGKASYNGHMDKGCPKEVKKFRKRERKEL